MLRHFDQQTNQKTALTDGFNVVVDSRLSLTSQAGLSLIYYKTSVLSNNEQHLRGPDGIRTRTSCLRNRQSTVNLQAQVTEAKLLYHQKKGLIDN